MGSKHENRSGDLFLTSQPEEPVRPAGLGSLGSHSYFFEPYTVRSPHRVHIGDDVMIGARALLSVVEEFMGERHDSLLTIGHRCEIGRDFFVNCVGRVEIGSDVGISARVFIGDADREYESLDTAVGDQAMSEPAPVRIGEHAVIGIGAIILRGVTVGEHAVVAAGSVVTRDVPPRSVVFGNPARVVRSWDPDAGRWVSGPLRKARGDGATAS